MKVSFCPLRGFRGPESFTNGYYTYFLIKSEILSYIILHFSRKCSVRDGKLNLEYKRISPVTGDNSHTKERCNLA
jgi:hypothetical protein